MRDYNFELGGVEFGIGQPVTVENFDTGTAEWRVQDSDKPMEDGTNFGRDYLSPPSWGFTMSTDGETAEEALAMVANLAAVWRNAAGRHTPGKVMPLRYTVGGRTRIVYGRPRRWSAPPTNKLLGGYLPISSDFKCADALHYEEVERSASVSIGGSSRGGFIFPLIFPMTVSSGGWRSGVVDVSGDAPTWAKVRFNGPVTNPKVTVGDWSCEWRGTIAADDWVEVNALPWERTALRKDGSSVSGQLSRTTRLSKMVMVPGRTEIIFTATTVTSPVVSTVSWRSASHSL